MWQSGILQYRRPTDLLISAVRAAAQQCRRRQPGKPQREVLHGSFVDVLWWLAIAQPALDANQLRSPWEWWVGSAQAWQVWVEAECRVWPTPPVDVDGLGVTIVPMSSHAALIQRSRAHRHCVADYAESCAGGTYLVFSLIDDRESVTAGYKRGAARDLWLLDQVRGPANAPASERMQIAATALATRLSSVAS